MPAWIDIAGHRYGRLVALKHLYGEDWKCRCDCGRDIIARSSHLRGGYKQSCGCLKRKSGEAYLRTPEYICWIGMHSRCSNPNNPKWKYYGGREIKVCERWHEFANFLADMGRRPPGQIFDRIDPDGNYTPLNCRWTSYITSNKNRRPFKRKSTSPKGSAA